MPLEGKRIVITGGAGFIGTTLARRLVDANDVVALDNLHRDALSSTELTEHPRFSFVQADVLDADAVREVGHGATHRALRRYRGRGHGAREPGADDAGERDRHVQRARGGARDGRHGRAAGRLLDERSLRPTRVQRAGGARHDHRLGRRGALDVLSKLAGEHMAHAYHAEAGLPTTSVRPFNVYGPGQIGGGAIRAFIEAALAGRDLTIHGDGSQIRAWCYVDDMVEGTLLALEHENAIGESFNIGNARSAVTIYDLAKRIKTLTGCAGEIVFQPTHYADVELRIPNVEKARTLLGFDAKVELDEASNAQSRGIASAPRRTRERRDPARVAGRG